MDEVISGDHRQSCGCVTRQTLRYPFLSERAGQASTWKRSASSETRSGGASSVVAPFAFSDQARQTARTPLSAVVHHPLFGLHLQEKMEELGLRYEVRCRGQEDVEPLSVVDFVRACLVQDG